jgi:hypothetical protein
VLIVVISLDDVNATLQRLLRVELLIAAALLILLALASSPQPGGAGAPVRHGTRLVTACVAVTLHFAALQSFAEQCELCIPCVPPERSRTC